MPPLGMAHRMRPPRPPRPEMEPPLQPLLALLGAPDPDARPRGYPRRLDRPRPLPLAGAGRGLATRTGQLHRTLRPDPPPHRRRQIRTRSPPPFVERLAPRLELAAHQPATPFGPPLQTRP